MRHELQNTTLAVVFIGNFNPAIITPFWFAGKGFIRESEAEGADVKIVHKQVAKFDIDWLSFDATPEKIIFTTQRESHWMTMRDLIVSTFSVLRETPIRAFGINIISDYTLAKEDAYRNLGDYLARRDIFSATMRDPRVARVSYTEEVPAPDEQHAGVLTVDIAIKDKKARFDVVQLKSNHHFDLRDGTTAEIAIKGLTEIWDEAINKGKHLNDNLWSREW